MGRQAEEQNLFDSSLMDTMGISVSKHLLDDALTVLWANESFYKNTGYSKEEYQISFASIREFYADYPEDFEKIRNAFLSAREKKETKVNVFCRMPVHGGGAAWICVNGTVTDETVDGYPVFFAVYSDVSEPVRLQQEQLRVAEERTRNFEWMIEEYGGNIYISDMDNYELLYLNKTAYETLGTDQGILGRKCYEVIQGRTSPCPFCTNDRLKTDETYEWEFFNPVLDRTFMIKNRMLNWNGRRARIELSHDMYSAEYKLAKKDQEREAIIRTIPGGLCRLDARDCSTVLWYDADYLNLIGYTAEQFEKELHSQCAYVAPDDLARTQKIMQTLRKTGQNTAIEIKTFTHAGEQKILMITLCYVDGQDSWDGIPSFYSIGIDVTKERAEQERQRKALEDAYKSARVANSAKTNFLSSMSHDIRTPMNAIVGMATIAQANLLSPDKVRDCLNKINVSSRHLLSLINEVLDMSKIESGKIDLTLEDVDLPELIENVTDMCRSLLSEKQHDFKINIGQVKHEKIIADGERLKQVFMNLLSNAIKYTPQGGKIHLTINELDSEIPSTGRFEFVFADNGIGMSQDFIPKIFEPFSRAEDSRISKSQGTGLGMAITENIVHMMNGTIEVRSRLGEGSQFTVSIPLQLQAEEEKGGEELVGLPVLVVDDDQDVCENATLLLNEIGMRGSWVLSGKEAVKCVAQAHDRREDYYAVILDWKMPEMDGLDTVKAIRGQLGEDVPIIIISAYDYSDIEEEFIQAGADAFITKPLFKSKMLHVLQMFCSSGNQETQSSLSENKHAGLNGKRILLAEDNELNREIAVELLEMQGLLVDAVENGQRAVELFAASAPGYYAAVLMDIQMPLMDGYEATTAIRSLKRKDVNELPVIALTANAFITDVGKARSVGMNDHITKPIDIDHMMAVLQRWIG